MVNFLDHALLDHRNVLGVYGYLRELQKSLIKSCPFYARYKNTDLPLDIKNLCLLLYNIPMQIDIVINKQVSDWIDMDYDGGVQSIDDMYINTCLIGYKITNKMCKRCVMAIEIYCNYFRFSGPHINNKYFYWRKDTKLKEFHESDENFKRGDIFGLYNCFDQDNFYILHNGTFCVCLPLNGWKSLMFAVSLCEKYDAVIPCRWQFSM